jgi:hypothetical protein
MATYWCTQSIMMVNSVHPGKSEGCTPSPFHCIYHLEQSCWCTLHLRGQIHSDILLLFLLYHFLLCVPSLLPPYCMLHQRERRRTLYVVFVFPSKGLADLCISSSTVIDYSGRTKYCARTKYSAPAFHLCYNAKKTTFRDFFFGKIKKEQFERRIFKKRCIFALKIVK